VIRTLIIIAAVAIAAWALVYLNREQVEDVVATKISEAIHSPANPSAGPSFIKDFGRGVGKKVLKLELGRF
jgi:hypothetical protein